MQTRRTDKSTESSPVMIISSVQGIIFPLELFPRFVLHRTRARARESAFLLLLYFFIPSFLFSLRFKVVIFSRPPFFQPVPRFSSLLIFFFGRSCAFVFEVQGLPLLFLNIFSQPLPRALEFLTLGASSFPFIFRHSRASIDLSRLTSSLAPINSVTFPFPFHLISSDRARLPPKCFTFNCFSLGNFILVTFPLK